MTSISAGPGNTGQPAFRLTCNDLQRITEQAIVELAANPYLLCEEAAAKAMFAKAAMGLKLDVLNQDTNKNLIAMRTSASTPGGYELGDLGRTCGGKVGQRNKDLLLSDNRYVGEADVQFKVHPGYGVKDLSTKYHVGQLVHDLISLVGGDSMAGMAQVQNEPADPRVQAVVLVLANTNGQLKWLDGSQSCVPHGPLPALIPAQLAQTHGQSCWSLSSTHGYSWTGWGPLQCGTEWVERGKGYPVRLKPAANHGTHSVHVQFAAFKAQSALNARAIFSGGAIHDIYAFVWMRPDAQGGMS